MAGGPKIGCTIDMAATADHKPKAFITTPANPAIISEKQVSSPSDVAQYFNDLKRALSDTTLATRAQPIQAPIVFENVPCGAAGAKTVLTHGFGHNARWTVLDWKGAGVVGGHSLVSDELDASAVLTSDSQLALRSYVTGTAVIMVF